jgi:cytochrome c oxidase assembly protein subunit 15
MNIRSLNWPHAVSCLLVATTAVLLCFGALVTTYEAAMAVPDWPGTYGHNMFLFPLADWLSGPWDLFLEHGHRLLGATVGVITLGLVAVVWPSRTTPAVRGLAVAAVLLVVAQGLLGGARVLLDDKTVAKVHACTGPLFFAVAVAIAALTRQPTAPGSRPSRSSLVVGLTTSLLLAAYLQLVAGAQLRHLDAAVDHSTFRMLVVLHLAGAAAVTGLAIAAAAATTRGDRPAARWWSRGILFFVGCQLVLGLAAWVVSWGMPAGFLPEAWQSAEPLRARSMFGAAVVTGHVVLGMLILGGSVVLAIVAGALERDPLRRLTGSPRPHTERAFA